MTRSRTSGLVAALLVSSLACATTRPPTLDTASAEYQLVSSDAGVKHLAGAELFEAQAALEKAEQASASGADEREVDHLTYVARQRSRIALVVAVGRAAEIIEQGIERQNPSLGE